MGIVNASPDSFSDGGLHATLDARLLLARELLAAGADILDVGGESASTGRPPVQIEEEIERVVPLVQLLAVELGALVSVDTYKPAVARAAIAAGARIVNDVSGLRDPELADVCAESGAALVLMHTLAAPRERLQDADLYDDVTGEVMAFLRERMALARLPRGRSRAADRRSGPGLRQDACADDPAARRRRAPARAGPAAADGDLAQGLHRRAHRAPAARTPGRHARRRSPTVSGTARTSSACMTSPPPPTSLPCAAPLPVRPMSAGTSLCPRTSAMSTSGPNSRSLHRDARFMHVMSGVVSSHSFRSEKRSLGPAHWHPRIRP